MPANMITEHRQVLQHRRGDLKKYIHRYLNDDLRIVYPALQNWREIGELGEVKRGEQNLQEHGLDQPRFLPGFPYSISLEIRCELKISIINQVKNIAQGKFLCANPDLFGSPRLHYLGRITSDIIALNTRRQSPSRDHRSTQSRGKSTLP